MVEFKATVRKWGNLLGFVIPKDIVKKENIKEKDIIYFLVLRK